MKRLLIVLLAAWPAVGSAASGIEQLRTFLKDTHTFRAKFEQRVTDARGAEMQHGAGEVMIERPGKFRWDYAQPAGQLIVSDGRKLWVYDRDLEQVTVRPMDTGMGSTPAQLLSGAVSLEKEFDIRSRKREKGLDWVELDPKQKDANFQRVELGFADGELRAMDLFDNFGQVTTLRFTQVDLNPALDPSLFRFEPPPGVDVIGEQ
jgi:outer membrane lipoprotein carrier protein